MLHSVEHLQIRYQNYSVKRFADQIMMVNMGNESNSKQVAVNKCYAFLIRREAFHLLSDNIPGNFLLVTLDASFRSFVNYVTSTRMKKMSLNCSFHR